MRGVLGVGALIALCGCSEYGARPHSPGQGGAAWVEVSSPHFRVLTDLPAADADGVAREFEDELDAIDQVEFEYPRTSTEATTVVVFSDASDFHAFVPRLLDGEFRRELPGDLEPSRFVVLHGPVTAGARVACLHELTHDLFERNFGPAPPWLNEGWAQYYSTIQVDQDKLRVGGALPHLSFTSEGAPFGGRAADGSYVLAMPIARVPPPSELLTMDRQTFYAFTKEQEPGSEGDLRGLAVYMGAWALVHMMHDGPQQYQVRYKRFMETVRDVQVESAWQSAFAGISAADFDRDFRAYLGRQQLTLFVYPRRKTVSDWKLTRRALPDSEVRILWSRLSPTHGAAEMAAKLDLDTAVSEAPDAPAGYYYRGLYWLHRGQLPAAESDLLEAARLAPKDPRFLLGVLILRIKQSQQARVEVHPGDAITQAAAPLTSVATSALQLRALALVYSDLGDQELALGFARRASALSPIDSFSLDVEAQVVSRLGRNQEALEIQRAAVAFIPEGVEAPDILAHLQTYEGRARNAHAPGAPANSD